MSENFPKMIKIESGVVVESGEVRSFYAHVHSYYEIILYESFDGEVYVGSNISKVNEHIAVVICPLDTHRILVRESNSAKYVKICIDVNDNFNTENSSYILENINSDDFIINLFKQILIENDNTYKNLIANLILYHLKKYGKRLSVTTNGKKTIMDALKYINDNYSKQITLKNCADYVCLTPEHLSKIFSLNTGITFSKYLTNLRLNKATELLINTTKSVTEICFECGFGNLSHFLRLFTKIKGVSPLKYRNLKSQSK